jgi:hypothetical protein
VKKTLLLLLFIEVGLTGYSQNEIYQSGARSVALSNATVTFRDHWAAFNNQAGLASLKQSIFGVYAENKYNIRELNSGSAVLVIPFKKLAVLGVSFFTVNNSIIFTRQKYGIALAKMFGENLSIGLQFDFLKSHFEGYSDNLSFCGEVGLLYKLTPAWDVGVHIFNPTASHYTQFEKERIPTVFRVGTGYKIGDNTLFVIEFENSSDSKFVIKGGIEYELAKKIVFEIGAHSNPFVNSFGIAFKGRSFRINISLQYHQVLSATPGISFDQVLFNQ